jgi:hypothetical protein
VWRSRAVQTLRFANGLLLLVGAVPHPRGQNRAECIALLIGAVLVLPHLGVLCLLALGLGRGARHIRHVVALARLKLILGRLRAVRGFELFFDPLDFDHVGVEVLLLVGGDASLFRFRERNNGVGLVERFFPALPQHFLVAHDWLLRAGPA